MSDNFSRPLVKSSRILQFIAEKRSLENRMVNRELSQSCDKSHGCYRHTAHSRPLQGRPRSFPRRARSLVSRETWLVNANSSLPFRRGWKEGERMCCRKREGLITFLYPLFSYPATAVAHLVQLLSASWSHPVYSFAFYPADRYTSITMVKSRDRSQSASLSLRTVIYFLRFLSDLLSARFPCFRDSCVTI